MATFSLNGVNCQVISFQGNLPGKQAIFGFGLTSPSGNPLGQLSIQIQAQPQEATDDTEAIPSFDELLAAEPVMQDLYNALSAANEFVAAEYSKMITVTPEV